MKFLKPIKIKKKNKRCPNCKYWSQYLCGEFNEKPPLKIFNNGCKYYKRNKFLYF